MKFYSLLLAVFAAFTMSARSDAGLFLSVDLDQNTAGVQSSRTFNIGDTVTASFVLNITEASENLVAFNFSTQYAGLEYVSRSEQPFSTGWLEAYTENAHSTTQAFDFDGLTTGAERTGPYSAQVGTLTLKVTQAGNFNITPGVFDNFVKEGFYNANGDVLSVGVSGGSVNVAAVPEPSSMALLATAGIGGWVARRRAARKNAAK
jgi:hypothetical protein